MIRILHVVSVMDLGGMESYIMNMYRNIDRTKMQFDFLVHHKRRGVFEDEIEELGGHVYHMSLMDDGNLIRYIRGLKKLFMQHPEYQIVHGHLGSTAYFYLGMAQRCGVSWRILHSHCPGCIQTLKGYIKHILFYFSPIHANVALACSTEAGKYQFKNRAFEVVPNGIDVRQFAFSKDLRDSKRKELGFEGKFVVGHVGRFYYEKNHEYMLKIFEQLKREIPDAVMMFVGDGLLKEQIEKKAREMRLEDSILFAGIQRECSPFYQAMDAFIMPSVYEALPLTGIEAQCAALPCLFSDTVSHEVNLGTRARFLPIGSENVDRWVNALVQIYGAKEERKEYIPNADAFDAIKITREMVARYEMMWENGK